MRLKIKKTGSFKFSKKYLDLISNSKVYDVAINTPITFAANLSGKLGNTKKYYHESKNTF